MNSQSQDPSGGAGSDADGTNGVRVVPVPSLITQSTGPHASGPTSTPSDQPSVSDESSRETSTAASASGPSASGESTGGLGNESAQETGVAQATQLGTVGASPGNSQILTLSSAVALQIVGKYLGVHPSLSAETETDWNSLRIAFGWSRGNIYCTKTEKAPVAARSQGRRLKTQRK